MGHLSNKYQKLFDLAGDGILLLQDNQFIDCNPRAAVMLGYSSPEDIIGLYPFDISPEIQPDGSRSREYSFLLNKAAYRHPLMFEWAHLAKGGEVRTIEVAITLFDKEERILLVHWRDVTERKAMEKEMLRQTSLLERTGRLARVGGWEFKHKRLLLSQQAANIFNLPEAGVYPTRAILRLLKRSSRQRLYEYLRNTDRSDFHRVLLLKTKKIMGSNLWLRLSGENLNGSGGNLQIAGAIQEVTETINAQKKQKAQELVIKQGHLQLMQAMSLAMDKRDPYTVGHQNRVADLSREIGTELGLDEMQIEGLVLGATLHDIGKIAIPAEILTRPGKISDEEMNLIKRHALLGFEIIQDISFPWPIALMVRQHHERLDGSGYPDGLKEDEIIIEAKIIAVADVVEAMSSHRPYRSALGGEVALQEIRKNKGNIFEPDVVDACLTVFSKGYQF